MITAAELDGMLAAGMTAEQVLQVVRVQLVTAETRAVRVRAQTAERTAKWRARKRDASQQGGDGGDASHASHHSQNIVSIEDFKASVDDDDKIAPKDSYLLTSTEDSLRKKKEGVTRARAKPVPLPDDWKPPERSYALAASLGVSVPDVEGHFRDWLAAKGMQYVNYDAGFCNFIRNAQKFSGNGNGRTKDARTRILEEVFGRNDGGRGQALDGDNTGLLPGFARR